MGTFHYCPKTSHTSNCISTTITSITIAPHVWDMKNFSSLNPKQQQPVEEKRENTEEIISRERLDLPHQQPLPSCIIEEEDIPRCEWEFSLSTVVSSTNDGGPASDTLGVIEFDPTDTLVATGGIARKIRVYSLNSLVPLLSSGASITEREGNINFLDHASACSYYICTPAKLSSIKWRPNAGGRIIGSGDYDGVVTEYDLERRIPTFERDEHGGRRVWSVDYTLGDDAQLLGASGSDDGTMQVWDPRCESDKCVAKVQPSVGGRSPVCCVEFNPFRGSILAVGCADRRAYCYDIRKMGEPLTLFYGHAKTVTYVRFLDVHSLVSASTDGCLKLWDIDSAGNCKHDPTAHLLRTYKGHINTRSFVGLSVWRNGGLLGCGSENNRVFVYDKRWGEPIWVRGFEPSSRGCSGGGGFVSSVCWRQVGEGEADECTLLAGGSDGVLQVFMGKRKTSGNSGNDSSAPSSSNPPETITIYN